MSGDLEDFLRRAAQRRQAKSAQAAQPSTPRPRQRPQYSNSRTERVVRSVEAEDAHDVVLAASVVDEADDPNSIRNRKRRIEKAKAEAERAKAEAAAAAKKAGVKTGKSSGVAVAMSGQKDLLAALKSPAGMRQAILLREIIDRPTHRW